MFLLLLQSMKSDYNIFSVFLLIRFFYVAPLQPQSANLCFCVMGNVHILIKAE